MDMMVHDANRDYVIVSWKPPNTTTEGPILGYFVDKYGTLIQTPRLNKLIGMTTYR